jgi:hypothetical protein
MGINGKINQGCCCKIKELIEGNFRTDSEGGTRGQAPCPSLVHSSQSLLYFVVFVRLPKLDGYLQNSQTKLLGSVSN